MKISQRISKAEQHFHLRKLYQRGWKKVSDTTIKGGNVTTFERIRDRKGKPEKQFLRIKYTNNGWISLY